MSLAIDADTELKIEDVGHGDPKDGDAFAVIPLRGKARKAALVIGRSGEDFVIHASGAEIKLPDLDVCVWSRS
jgi:hypothetical protein